MDTGEKVAFYTVSLGLLLASLALATWTMNMLCCQIQKFVVGHVSAQTVQEWAKRVEHPEPEMVVSGAIRIFVGNASVLTE